MAKEDLKLVIALSRAHRSLVVSIEKWLRPFELSISEFGVLEFLLHKGNKSVQEIAKRILVTSGTITYVIDKLVSKSLVQRTRCPEDNRRYTVELTSEGADLIRRIFPLHEKFLNQIFSDVSMQEQNQLIESLFRLDTMIVHTDTKEQYHDTSIV
ncbi:MAG: MarR family transcriptional regulator [Sphaerochaetaceae bacterium]|nr:MarR family transcriptional regulator [Sphaerochaetaceae bacterium]